MLDLNTVATFASALSIPAFIFSIFAALEMLPRAQKRAVNLTAHGLRVSSYLSGWPSKTSRLIDSIFGPRHLSVRCFLVSSSLSICSLAAATAATVAFETCPLEIRWTIDWSDALLGLAILACGFVIVPDYICLLKTRFVLKHVRDTASWKLILGVIAVDFAASLAIVAIFSACTIIIWRWLWLGLNVPLRHALSIYPFSSFLPRLVFTAIVPSLWLWFYACACLAADLGTRVDRLYKTFVKPFSLHPFLALGTIVSLAFTLALTVALVVGGALPTAQAGSCMPHTASRPAVAFVPMRDGAKLVAARDAIDVESLRLAAKALQCPNTAPEDCDELLVDVPPDSMSLNRLLTSQAYGSVEVSEHMAIRTRAACVVSGRITWSAGRMLVSATIVALPPLWCSEDDPECEESAAGFPVGPIILPAWDARSPDLLAALRLAIATRQGQKAPSLVEPIQAIIAEDTQRLEKAMAAAVAAGEWNHRERLAIATLIALGNFYLSRGELFTQFTQNLRDAEVLPCILSGEHDPPIDDVDKFNLSCLEYRIAVARGYVHVGILMNEAELVNKGADLLDDNLSSILGELADPLAYDGRGPMWSIFNFANLYIDAAQLMRDRLGPLPRSRSARLARTQLIAARVIHRFAHYSIRGRCRDGGSADATLSDALTTFSLAATDLDSAREAVILARSTLRGTPCRRVPEIRLRKNLARAYFARGAVSGSTKDGCRGLAVLLAPPEFDKASDEYQVAANEAIADWMSIYIQAFMLSPSAVSECRRWLGNDWHRARKILRDRSST